MFSISFWRTAAEHAIITGASAFAATLTITTTPSLHDLYAALVAGGIGALYAFIKQLGGVQATSSIPKVKASA